MKRYLVFTGSKYYPSGGWDDFRGTFDTVEEAQKALLPSGTGLNCQSFDWYQIVDTTTMRDVS